MLRQRTQHAIILQQGRRKAHDMVPDLEVLCCDYSNIFSRHRPDLPLWVIWRIEPLDVLQRRRVRERRRLRERSCSPGSGEDRYPPSIGKLWIRVDAELLRSIALAWRRYRPQGRGEFLSRLLDSRFEHGTVVGVSRASAE